jgi:uncharacterized membrane protein
MMTRTFCDIVSAKTAFFIKPENMFLLLAFAFGISFLLAVPPFQVPDEPNHFYRAYQISEGRFVPVKVLPPVLDSGQLAERDSAAAEIRSLYEKGDLGAVKAFNALKNIGGIGGPLPKSLAITTDAFLHLIYPQSRQKVRDLVPLLTLPLDRDNRSFLHFPNTALYSPVPYLPQAFGIGAGRAFDFSPLVLMYLGRLSNLLVWALLVYLSLRIIPLCKWVFFLLALMPTTLYEASSLAADGFTIGISFLLIALIARNAFDTSETTTNVYLLTAVSLLLALSKQAYFLMPLLFLLIPANRVGSKRKFYATFFLLNLLVISAIITWTLKADFQEDLYRIYGFLLPTWSAKKQTLFILSNPLEYCRILGATFVRDGKVYIDSVMSYQSDLLKIAFFFTALLALLGESSDHIAISLKQRLLILVTLCLSVLLVVTLAYIGWTSVGAKTIGGVQGRYFIPLSPLVFLMCYRSRGFFSMKKSLLCLLVTSFSVAGLSHTLYIILRRFYF